MLDDYLTPNQKRNKMVAQLSLGDKWEARGEIRGEARGEIRGKAKGEQIKARLTVLRGYFKGQNAEFLADLCVLPLKEALELKTGYDAVKKAWQEKKIDISTLSRTTTLSEQEVQHVIDCLDSISLA